MLTHGDRRDVVRGLLFSDSDLIRKFGEAGLIATIIALVAVLSLVPLFGVLLLRNEEGLRGQVPGADAGMQMLRNFCYWIAVRMVGRPGLFSLMRCCLVGGLAVVYANLQPRYRLADQVPDKQQAVAASSRLDAKLTGANPIDVLDRISKGRVALCPRDTADHRRSSFAWSRNRRASATSGRSKRCDVGSPRKPARRMSRR